jgi:hypothetical protein
MGLAGIVEQQREQQHALLRQLQQELAVAPGAEQAFWMATRVCSSTV